MSTGSEKPDTFKPKRPRSVSIIASYFIFLGFSLIIPQILFPLNSQPYIQYFFGIKISEVVNYLWPVTGLIIVAIGLGMFRKIPVSRIAAIIAAISIVFIEVGQVVTIIPFSMDSVFSPLYLVRFFIILVITILIIHYLRKPLTKVYFEINNPSK